MANEIQRTIPYVTQMQSDTVCSRKLQLHKRNNRRSNRMTYYIMSEPSPTQRKISNTLFNIISLGVNAYARSKLPQHNIVNTGQLFTP